MTPRDSSAPDRLAPRRPTARALRRAAITLAWAGMLGLGAAADRPWRAGGAPAHDAAAASAAASAAAPLHAAAPAAVQRDPRLRITHILGGGREAVVAGAHGSIAYVGVGSRIEVVEVDADGTPRSIFETPPLSPLLHELVYDLERSDSLLIASLRDRVVLLDLADPRRPRPVGEREVAPGRLGLTAAEGLAAVLVGRDEGGILFDTSDPASLRELGRFDLPGAERDHDLSPDGRLLYAIAESLDGSREGVPWVVDVTDPTAPVPIGPVDPELEGVEALAVDEEGGVLWLAVAGREGIDGGESTTMRAFDLSDPAQPVALAALVLPAPRVFRLRAAGGRAYVGTWTDAGPVATVGRLHVLALEEGAPRVVAQGVGAGLPHDAAPLADGRVVAVHDLGLSVLGGDPDSAGAGLPIELLELGRHGGPGWWKNVVAAGDRAYVSGSHAMQVIDVGARPPRERGFVHTLGERVNLINGAGMGAAIEGDTLVLANRRAGAVQALDVSDPDAPRETGRFASSSALSFDAEAVVARDGLAHVAGGRLPLLVLDVTGPASPTLSATLPTLTGRLTGGRTVALGPGRIHASGASDRPAVGENLLALEVVPRRQPRILSAIDVPGDRPRIRGIAAAGDLVVAAVESREGGRLRVADVSDPTAPQWLPGSLDLGLVPHVLAYDPPWVFALGYPMGLAAIDLSDPGAPREVDRVPALSGGLGLAVAEDGRIFVAAGDGGLVTLSFQDPAKGATRTFLPWGERR